MFEKEKSVGEISGGYGVAHKAVLVAVLILGIR